jgi:hypothetical protein
MMDGTILDTLLKAKWNGMKTALNEQNVTGALNKIPNISKDMFEFNFNLLIDRLPQIVADFHNITLVRVGNGFAEYEMWAEQGGDTTSFVIYFVRDTDGIWRVQFF